MCVCVCVCVCVWGRSRVPIFLAPALSRIWHLGCRWLRRLWAELGNIFENGCRQLMQKIRRRFQSGRKIVKWCKRSLFDILPLHSPMLHLESLESAGLFLAWFSGGGALWYRLSGMFPHTYKPVQLVAILMSS